MPARVLFDATALCAAFLTPDGLDMQLLQMARAGVVEPVFTQEVVAEWVRNARAGRLDGIRYDAADIEAFCRLLEPLLSSRMIRRLWLGRAMSPLYPIVRQSGIVIIQHPATGFAHTESRMLDAQTLALKDIGDLHVVLAALYHDCDYICTYNTADLPEGLDFAGVRCVRPGTLMQMIRSGEIS